MWANVSSSWAQQCTNIQILFVFSFFVPNSLARRCKLVAHLLWFFSKSWLRCNAALLLFSFSFFATLVSCLFFCSWFLLYARFIPHSPCSALCFSCHLLIVMLLYMCFSAEFFCCARLFFSSSFFRWVSSCCYILCTHSSHYIILAFSFHTFT